MQTKQSLQYSGHKKESSGRDTTAAEISPCQSSFMPDNGPATRNDSIASNNTSGTTPNATPTRQIVAERLREAGIAEDRFIQLQDGSKSPIDHTQHKPQVIDGNYGVYAGRGLVLLDLDTYDGGCPKWVNQLPRTFTVRTPHGGEHRYFTVESAIANAEFDGGSIRAENQYVVGPGSDLDSCNKDWHDCSQDGEGYYTVLHDRPIASVSATVFPDGQGNAQGQTTSNDIANVTADITDLGEVDAPFGDLDQRLHAFLNTDTEIGEIREKLWTGQWNDLGYNDRSTPEMALVAHLGWFFEGNAEVVGQLMSLACHQYPSTDLSKPRKWAVEDRPSYRQSTLAAMPDYEETYEPGSSHVGLRPKVSHITYENVMVATAKVGPARVEEVAAHEGNDRSKRQTERALMELIDDGMVGREKRPNGKRGPNPYFYWVIGYES